MNSIDELLGNNKKEGVSEKGKESKVKSFKDKTFLYVNELKYPLSLTVATLLLGIGVSQTLLLDESEMSMKHMYGDGRAQLVQLENDSLNLVNNTNSLTVDLNGVQNQILIKRQELDEANATITNLTQGYYFIAYLDSLFNKHGITLDKFDINLKDTGIANADGSTNIITLNNLVDIQIPKGDYSLLPLDIEFTTSSESLRALFNEFYTRRIVYDKDLRVTNNLDNSVTVRTKIEFTKTTVAEEGAEQSQTPVNTQDPTLTPTTDDWDMGGDVAPQSETNSMDTPSVQDMNGGTQ